MSVVAGSHKRRVVQHTILLWMRGAAAADVAAVMFVDATLLLKPLLSQYGYAICRMSDVLALLCMECTTFDVVYVGFTVSTARVLLAVGPCGKQPQLLCVPASKAATHLAII